MNNKHRLIIYPKDISLITGRSVRYCRKTMARIRTKKGKDKYQPVTIFDLADYLGVDLEVLADRIH